MFFFIKSRQTTFDTHVFKVYINFKHKKELFKKSQHCTFKRCGFYPFIIVSKAHIHKLFFLRHCTNIVFFPEG